MVVLSPTAIDVLKIVRTRQMVWRLAAGVAWQESNHIFTEIDGRPVDADRVSKDFARRVREVAMPHLSLHGLRHCHASLMLKAGVHPKVVSERLGHASVAITLDVYSHLVPSLQDEAAIALDDILRSSTPAA